MKAFLRWLAKVIGSAITLVLVIVLFPYVSKLAAKLMPDESGAAIKASAILSAKLENSARLETLKVSEEGVLNYEIKPAFLPTIASIRASYQYDASFGIDLSKVTIRVDGNRLTFLLPEHELIQDSLTPVEVYRDDYWYPGFSDADYEKLMEDERLARRNVYLSGEKESVLWEATVAAFKKTIAPWLQTVNANLVFSYQPAEPSEQN